MWKLKSVPLNSERISELCKHGWEPFASVHDGTAVIVLLRKYDSGVSL